MNQFVTVKTLKFKLYRHRRNRVLKQQIDIAAGLRMFPSMQMASWSVPPAKTKSLIVSRLCFLLRMNIVRWLVK